MNKLNDLLKELNLLSVSGSIDYGVSGIFCDSRMVIPNSIYVAIEGTKSDGHAYLNDAVSKGADVLVVSEGYEGMIPLCKNVIRVRNTALAYADLCRAFFDFPDRSLLTFGITGTNGKSTTTYIIKSIMEKAGYTTGVIGTLGYSYNDVHKNLEQTTPSAGELFGIMHKMRENGVKALAMEVSSHAISQKRTGSMEFNSSIFTNLTQDHLDYHKDMDDYFTTKCSLFREMTGYKGSIVNADDPYGKKIIELLGEHCLYTYGINNPDSDIRATSIKTDIEKSTFIVETKNQDYPITLNSPGIFNIYNALSAFAATFGMNIDSEYITKGLCLFMESVVALKELLANMIFLQLLIMLILLMHFSMRLKKLKLLQIKTYNGFWCRWDRDNSKRSIMGRAVSSMSDILYYYIR
jgi:UDP-N-acetylmuramyl-tripeptide synthetase